jgi:F0F1-type ATP synthase assembly protein I
LQGCDAAYQSCDKANSDKAEVIEKQQALLQVVTDQNASLQKGADSQLKTILGFVAGILVTGAIVHFTK